MIKVTFEFDTNADAIGFLQTLDQGQELIANAGAEPTKKGPGRPRKEAAAPSPAAPAAAPAVAATPAQAAGVDTSPARYKQFADKVMDLATIDETAARAILAKFGVAGANLLKPEQWPVVEAEFVAELAKRANPSKPSLV